VHAPPPVIAENFFKVQSDSEQYTRFVTIYGFVQSNIQHVSPASGGFETPSGLCPWTPLGDFRPPKPPLLSPNKFLATSLIMYLILALKNLPVYYPVMIFSLCSMLRCLKQRRVSAEPMSRVAPVQARHTCVQGKGRAPTLITRNPDISLPKRSCTQ